MRPFLFLSISVIFISTLIHPPTHLITPRMPSSLNQSFIFKSLNVEILFSKYNLWFFQFSSFHQSHLPPARLLAPQAILILQDHLGLVSATSLTSQNPMASHASVLSPLLCISTFPFSGWPPGLGSAYCFSFQMSKFAGEKVISSYVMRAPSSPESLSISPWWRKNHLFPCQQSPW